MALRIKWVRSVPLHVGSSEMLGTGLGPNNNPFHFLHAEDDGVSWVNSAMTSSFGGWTYNQGDYTANNKIANRLVLRARGGFSYNDYASYRNIAVSAGIPSEPWNGQQQAATVFGHPKANKLQPSGMGIYTAFLENPGAAGPTKVRVRVNGWVFLTSRTQFRPNVGGGKTVDGTASAFNGNVLVAEARSKVDVSKAIGVGLKLVSAKYVVTVPAGGSVKVGRVQVGVGYTISSGTNKFRLASALWFRTKVLPQGAHGSGGTAPSGGSSEGG
ncbi:MAG: hypothetical protein AAF351_03620 [Pseudomonadota bacterium]